MQFGVLAGNQHINSRIYEMFATIDPDDVTTFVRKFRTERDQQRLHTFRELVVGSHLRGRGIQVRYEQEIRGKTPDWVVYDMSGEVEELVDVVSLHQRKETETEIIDAVSTGEAWTGWTTIPPNHLYAKIEQKANLYAGLAEECCKPYSVFLFGEFFASVDPEEVEHVLYGLHGGLFSSQPTLSGLAYFTESMGTYTYSYFVNDAATFPSSAMRTLGRGGAIAA